MMQPRGKETNADRLKVVEFSSKADKTCVVCMETVGLKFFSIFKIIPV